MKVGLLSAASILVVVGAVYAVGEPPLKEGLWSIKTQIIDNPGNDKSESTRSIYRNHAYDAHANSIAKAQNCETISENRSGATLSRR